MKLIHLDSKSKGEFEGQKAQETDYDLLMEESCTVYKPDGTLLCVLLKRAHDPNVAAKAWSAIRDLHLWTNNRITASGEGMIRKNKQVVSAEKVDSGILGYFERTSRFPYCRACAWNLENPDKWQALVPLVQDADQLFQSFARAEYSRQALVAKKSHPDFLIAGTQFSTLTVNKNFRTAYHRDAGNLPDGISCMSVLREGKWTGANLVFPEFRVAAKMDSLDMIIFDPHELHGNTRLVQITPNAIRCSIVYYFRDKIQHCLSASEELDRVQNRKQGEELYKTIRRVKE